MSNLQLIEALCEMIEIFCDLVRKLASKLEQIGALDTEEKRAIECAFGRYSKTIGAEEIPDWLSEEEG